MEQQEIEDSIQGITVFKCNKCSKLEPIEVRLPGTFAKGEWEKLFQTIQENKMLCKECKNERGVE